MPKFNDTFRYNGRFMNGVTTQDLSTLRLELKQLVAFTEEVRKPNGQYSVKTTELMHMFQACSQWIRVKKKGGHAKFQNSVTHVVVEFQAHKKRSNETNLDPGAVNGVLDAVQKHINIVCNQIFQPKNNIWQKNYPIKQALINYQTLFPA